MKTRNRIINKIKSQYWKKEYKFGILLPKNVDYAIRIDTLNDNHFWRKSIEKELKTVYVAYKQYEQKGEDITPEQICAERQKHLIGYKEITCHFLFDVKLDGSFTRKARFARMEVKLMYQKLSHILLLFFVNLSVLLSSLLVSTTSKFRPATSPVLT